MLLPYARPPSWSCQAFHFITHHISNAFDPSPYQALLGNFIVSGASSSTLMKIFFFSLSLRRVLLHPQLQHTSCVDPFLERAASAGGDRRHKARSRDGGAGFRPDLFASSRRGDGGGFLILACVDILTRIT